MKPSSLIPIFSTRAHSTLSAPYFTNQYNPTQHGVNVDAAVNQLYALVTKQYNNSNTFTLRGPPGCGKTTVVRTTAQRHQEDCTFYEAPDKAIRAWKSDSEAFFSKNNFIDEAQQLPKIEEQLTFLTQVRMAPKSTVFSGTFSNGLSPGSGCWLFLDGRFGDKDQTAQWFRDGLKQLGLTNDIDSFTSYCIAVTDCHAPLLNNIGYFLQEPKHSGNRHKEILSAEKEQINLVMKAIQDHRLFRKNGKNKVEDDVEPIVKNIVSLGSAKADLTNEAVRNAVTGGLFVPIPKPETENRVGDGVGAHHDRQIPPSGPLCIVEALSSLQEVCRLAHPTQWSLCQPIHDVWNQQQEPIHIPSCPIDLLLAILPCLPPTEVQNMYFDAKFLPNQHVSNPITCLEGGIGSPQEDRQKMLFRKSLKNVADRYGWSLTEEDEPNTGTHATKNRKHRYDLKLTLEQTCFGFEFLAGHKNWTDPYTRQQESSRVPILVNRKHAYNFGEELSFVGDFAEHHLRWEMPSFSQKVAETQQCMTIAFLGPSFAEVDSAQITELEQAVEAQRRHLQNEKDHKGCEAPWCVVHFISHTNMVVWYKPAGGKANMHRIVGDGVPRRFDEDEESVMINTNYENLQAIPEPNSQPSAHWVQVVPSGSDPAEVYKHGIAVQAEPKNNTISSLKTWISEHEKDFPPLKGVPSTSLKIWKPNADGTQWEEVKGPQSTPLEPTTEEHPYHVSV